MTLEPVAHLPSSPCPGCGHVNNAATDTASVDGTPPSPGDYAVCFYCATLAVYADDLTLRDPTREDLVTAPAAVFAAQRDVQAWLRTQQGQRP